MKIILLLAIIVLLASCTNHIQQESHSYASSKPVVMGSNVQENQLSDECLALVHDQTCETVCEEGFCERICVSTS
jgi:hypothetical protein